MIEITCDNNIMPDDCRLPSDLRLAANEALASGICQTATVGYGPGATALVLERRAGVATNGDSRWGNVGRHDLTWAPDDGLAVSEAERAALADAGLSVDD